MVRAAATARLRMGLGLLLQRWDTTHCSPLPPTTYCLLPTTYCQLLTSVTSCKVGPSEPEASDARCSRTWLGSGSRVRDWGRVRLSVRARARARARVRVRVRVRVRIIVMFRGGVRVELTLSQVASVAV